MFDCSKVCPKKCKADCCQYVPFGEAFWKKHKDKAQVEVKVLKWSENHILPLTENLRCCFLDKDSKCVVYDDRPWICKAFGTSNKKGLACPYLKPNGGKRGKAERIRMVGENHDNLLDIAKKINKTIELISKGKSAEEIKAATEKIQ